MLLDKKADVTVRNTHDQSPLDQAIDHFHNDVALAMLRHKTYVCLKNYHTQFWVW